MARTDYRTKAGKAKANASAQRINAARAARANRIETAALLADIERYVAALEPGQTLTVTRNHTSSADAALFTVQKDR